jgi:hypothetical protein
VVSTLDGKANFIIYDSAYQNLEFAGKIIWYSPRRFAATVTGEEGLMLADFIVD